MFIIDMVTSYKGSNEYGYVFSFYYRFVYWNDIIIVINDES